jgi:hypothetical protein
MKILCGVVTVLLCFSSLACAGYTIRELPQIGKYVVVPGAYGPVQRLNQGPATVDPPGYHGIIYEPPGFDRYSTDPASRRQLLDDAGGTATSAEIFAAFPGIRIWKGDQVRREGARRLEQLVQPYTAAERESWSVQMQEAEAYLADPEAAVPLIATMAQARGITTAELVAKIRENMQLYRLVAGEILGRQQYLLDWIDRETDFSVFLGISWD